MRQSLLFFNSHEAETIEAATARILPSDDLGPGALEAGAVVYIDRALAGPYAHLQDAYREGIRALDRAADAGFGSRFADLSDADQDRLLRDLDRGGLSDLGAPEGFMGLLVRHTREGVFCDPAHGGNRDLVGWRLLGYPGIHRVWHHDEQQIGSVIRPRPVTTMADERFGIELRGGSRG